MSDVGVHGRGLIVGLALSVSAGQARAQQDTHAFAIRLDSVSTALDSVNATIKRMATRAEPKRIDTVPLQVGALFVVTEPQLRGLATAAATEASDSLTAHFGTTLHLLDGLRFHLRSGHGMDSLRMISTIVDSTGAEAWMTSLPANARVIADAWESTAGSILALQVTGVVRDWAGGVPLGMENAWWGNVRRDMATDAIHVVRDCIAGSISACSAALEVTPAANPLADWYDATDRLGFAKHFLSERAPSEYLPARALCVGCDSVPSAEVRTRRLSLASACVHGASLACDSLFVEWNQAAQEPPHPVSNFVRQSVLREALAVGGPQAYGRLVQSHGTVAERLQQTAGVPVDSLLRAWRERVMTVGRSDSIDSVTLTSSLLWALACGAVGLRSSRWR